MTAIYVSVVIAIVIVMTPCSQHIDSVSHVFATCLFAEGQKISSEKFQGSLTIV